MLDLVEMTPDCARDDGTGFPHRLSQSEAEPLLQALLDHDRGLALDRVHHHVVLLGRGERQAGEMNARAGRGRQGPIIDGARFCSVRLQTPARPSARICVADKLVCALVGARPAPSASDRSTTGTTWRLRTDQLVSREVAFCDVLTSAPPLTEGQQLPQLSRSRRGRWSQRL